MPSYKVKMRKNWKLWFECYQLAGGLLLISPKETEIITKGQRQRLTELLLDVLSEPHRYNARLVRDLRRMAMEP